MKKTLGVMILLAVFGTVFAATVADRGFTGALIVWGVALGITALIRLGVWLAVDG